MEKEIKNEQIYTGEIPNTPLRFVLHVSRHFKLIAWGAILSVVVARAAEMAAFYVLSDLIDSFSAAAKKADQLDILFYWGGLVILLGVIDRIAWRSSGFLGIAWAIRADQQAYKELYQYVTLHSHTYFSNRFAGAISNKISNAAGNAADLIMRFLWDILPAIMTILISLYLLFEVHWLFALLFIATLVLVFLFNLWWVKRRRPLVVAYSAASSRFRGVGVDLITNVSAMRQYSRRTKEMDDLNEVLTDRVTKDFKQSYSGEWLMVINGLFGAIFMAAVVWGMYIMLDRDMTTVGQLVLVLLLLMRIGYTFNSLGNMMNAFVRKYGEIEEGLDEVIVPYEVADSKDSTELSVSNGSITWQAVTFAYQEEDIFKRLSLNIKPGERVGLVGPSGAGKSTFVSLLLRQHDIQYGQIMIDGQNIAEVTQDSLRQNIALVPQEPMLFHRTIRENILYGKPDATEEEMILAATRAQAHEFIATLPDGYDTLVGERGVKLSGGQKQRVAIARAMLKEAPLLVLDEATSALDSESEVAIQQALEELMVGKTVIAVAHRLSTLRKMDRILVFENGKIIEDGSHDELANGNGLYAKLWKHQAGGFLQD